MAGDITLNQPLAGGALKILDFTTISSIMLTLALTVSFASAATPTSGAPTPGSATVPTVTTHPVERRAGTIERVDAILQQVRIDGVDFYYRSDAVIFYGPDGNRLAIPPEITVGLPVRFQIRELRKDAANEITTFWLVPR